MADKVLTTKDLEVALSTFKSKYKNVPKWKVSVPHKSKKKRSQYWVVSLVVDEDLSMRFTVLPGVIPKPGYVGFVTHDKGLTIERWVNKED